MIIDAHQHFWRVDRGDYDWLTPAAGDLYRDFAAADLAPLLARTNIRGTVLVQAAATEEETHYLFELAHKHAFVKGVVGWTDFAAADAADRIAQLKNAGAGKLKGLRPMIQDIADPDWVQEPRLDAAFDAVIAHDLVFDALVRPRHFNALKKRLQRHPQLRTVIDHGGKPDIAHAGFDLWALHLERVAQETEAYCKLSGLLTEAAPGATIDDLAPYVDHIFACFGAERVIWGSDWPVVNLASNYFAWLDMARALVARCAPNADAAVFGGTAASVYRLDSPQHAEIDFTRTL